ncbi:MAG TPA: biotin/lipoyl-containing protein, partial [Candidatus Elarobacter sp.]|nr:biotin/lipoyl-containing protein [Candidatus Elarobacter sp.]
MSARPPFGTVAVIAPIAGRMVSIDVAAGERIRAGAPVAVLESMKMEHVIAAERSGIVRRIAVQPGAVVAAGDPVLYLEPAEVEADPAAAGAAHAGGDDVRADLAELLARRAALRDDARPDAVAKRRERGQRTARENLAQLFDGGEFLEYGEFALAAQRRRRGHDELLRISPADGLITGIGHVNGDRFGDEHSRCIALAYDYTVLAG